MPERLKTAPAHSVASHFEKCEPEVSAIYRKVLAAARKLGPVAEDPKKTSIHLVNGTAFAGVATRRSALILTLKSPTDVKSPRVTKREQASKNRWHLEVRLESVADLDRQVLALLAKSYAMSE